MKVFFKEDWVKGKKPQLDFWADLEELDVTNAILKNISWEFICKTFSETFQIKFMMEFAQNNYSGEERQQNFWRLL